MNDQEYSFFKMPNEAVDIFMKQLSGNEYKCLEIIVRKTRGWNKEQDCIAVSQFMQIGGMGKDTVFKVLKKLKEKKLIQQISNKGTCSTFSLSEDFFQLAKEGCPNKEDNLERRGSPRGSNTTPTYAEKSYTQKTSNQKTLKKDNILKKVFFSELSDESKTILKQEILEYCNQYKLSSDEYDQFINAVQAKGYQYVDFFAAFQLWMDRKYLEHKKNKASVAKPQRSKEFYEMKDRLENLTRDVNKRGGDWKNHFNEEEIYILEWEIEYDTSYLLNAENTVIDYMVECLITRKDFYLLKRRLTEVEDDVKENGSDWKAHFNKIELEIIEDEIGLGYERFLNRSDEDIKMVLQRFKEL